MQYQFVSGDDHMDLAYIPARMWQERVPAKFKDQAPRVEETPQGRRWVCEGKPWAFGDYGTMRGARLTGAIPRAGVAEEPEPWDGTGQSSATHGRSEEHTSELQSLAYLVCRLLLEKKKKKQKIEV